MAEQKELIEQAEKALKAGYHNKALKLAKEIEDERTRGIIVAKATKAKAEAQVEAEAAPKKREYTKPEVVTPQNVLDAYAALMDTLAEIEVQERGKARPYRFYFFHRRQVENLMRNFKKGMRI